MNPQTKVKVTGLTITSPVYKSSNSMGKPCFAVDGIYTLENGTTRNTRVTTTRKKDMADAIATKRNHAEKGGIHIDGPWEVISYSLR
jgi:hypothetical protein